MAEIVKPMEGDIMYFPLKGMEVLYLDGLQLQNSN